MGHLLTSIPEAQEYLLFVPCILLESAVSVVEALIRNIYLRSRKSKKVIRKYTGLCKSGTRCDLWNLHERHNKPYNSISDTKSSIIVMCVDVKSCLYYWVQFQSDIRKRERKFMLARKYTYYIFMSNMRFVLFRSEILLLCYIINEVTLQRLSSQNLHIIGNKNLFRQNYFLVPNYYNFSDRWLMQC